MEKIVLDTNVLIDGAKDELSASWQIVQDVLEGKLKAFVSRPLKREYKQILGREIEDPDYHKRIQSFLRIVTPVSFQQIPNVIPDDPEDNKVLATATAAHAEALISEDQHLLALDPYEGIRVMTPQEFANLKADEDSSWVGFRRLIGIK